MKTLFEDLIKASKVGVNEFKTKREESGRTLKDDKDEILEELRKSVEKGKGFAKQTHEKAKQSHEKAKQEFKNRSQRKDDNSDKDLNDETCDFPFCNCDEICKKEQNDCDCDQKECKNNDEDQDQSFEMSLDNLLKAVFGDTSKHFEKLIDLKHVMELIEDVNETTYILLEDVEEGVINPSKTKNAIFLLSLLKVKLMKLTNTHEENEIDKLEQDILDLSNELDNVNHYLQSSELADLIYAIDIVFE